MAYMIISLSLHYRLAQELAEQVDIQVTRASSQASEQNQEEQEGTAGESTSGELADIVEQPEAEVVLAH